MERALLFWYQMEKITGGTEGVVEQLSKKDISVFFGRHKEGGVIPRVQGGYVLDEMGEPVKSKRRMNFVSCTTNRRRICCFTGGFW